MTDPRDDSADDVTPERERDRDALVPDDESPFEPHELDMLQESYQDIADD